MLWKNIDPGRTRPRVYVRDRGRDYYLRLGYVYRPFRKGRGVVVVNVSLADWVCFSPPSAVLMRSSSLMTTSITVLPVRSGSLKRRFRRNSSVLSLITIFLSPHESGGNTRRVVVERLLCIIYHLNQKVKV